MAAADTIQAKAGGTIEPARFVRLTAAYSVVQASAGNQADVVGVSGEDSRDAPQAGSATAHAAAGDSVVIHGYGRICRLTAGAAISAGDRLMSDATGRGIAATATNKIKAIALEPAVAADDLVLVMVLQPTTV